ncbi:loader of DNA helicase [Synechococcus phage S-N03]|uniref:Loader of DNA helicase n=1 Tax=Synechococcus phage S-N03 TaxID=2718943 RepID=A0A6G8R5Y1_9CAUD|nr:loader of DNA helicase [Synechococcus phage S-N03]QIN96800.1 loader of DNA helicase [Synechococcus phage S-N03]
MVFHGFDVYRTFLAMKQHFSNEKYDFFKYDGKVNAKESTYQQRNDFYFFESLARKLTPIEVKEYLLSNFVYASDPSKVWIGNIKRSGKDNWVRWQKQNQNLSYNFTQDLNKLISLMEQRGYSFNDLFKCDHGHPPLLRLYIKKELSLETIIILDMVLGFMLRWDQRMDDPLWSSLSLKIKKYKPFMSIPVKDYKKLMKDTFI